MLPVFIRTRHYVDSSPGYLSEAQGMITHTFLVDGERLLGGEGTVVDNAASKRALSRRLSQHMEQVMGGSEDGPAALWPVCVPYHPERWRMVAMATPLSSKIWRNDEVGEISADKIIHAWRRVTGQDIVEVGIDYSGNNHQVVERVKDMLDRVADIHSPLRGVLTPVLMDTALVREIQSFSPILPASHLQTKTPDVGHYSSGLRL